MAINNLSGRFDDQRWLTAHNAWNTNQYPGNNQSKTITELLDYGVRGFALDIYGDDEASLHLQHGHGNPATSIKWSIIWAELKVWLESHTNEIVTLFFESYLEGPKPNVVWNSPPALVALENSLSKIPCYRAGRSVQESAMADKTLNELINERNANGVVTGHRLFAFIEHEPDEGPQQHFPVMTATFTENVYGDESLKLKTWVNLRKDSSVANRLTFMNHFGDSPVASRWDGNDIGTVLNQAFCFVFSLGSGRFPNFISLDEIGWGDNKQLGPIRITGDLRQRRDLAPRAFEGGDKNEFDEVIFDMTGGKITDLTVTTARAQGITLIRAWRDPKKTNKITSIQVVTSAGYGIVNLRFKYDNGPWRPWLTEFETDQDAKNNKDITAAEFNNFASDLVAIACRRLDGRGVTGFAVACATY